jgi:hypothetical protein
MSLPLKKTCILFSLSDKAWAGKLITNKYLLINPYEDDVKNRKLAKEIIVTTICMLLLYSYSATAKEVETPVSVERIDIGVIAPVKTSSGAMQQGLSVIYYKKYSKRNLNSLPEDKSAKYPSFRGEPIAQLNHQFGKGNVFGSGTNRLIGMRMKGFLNLSEPGGYQFQALANDGIKVTLFGKTLLNDPSQHSDRLTNIGLATVTTTGWHEVVVEYFQRKGTAALVLYWKEPGKQKFVPIPKEIYSHIP